MSAERRIRAGELIRDIRSGMNDAELMEKYRLSVKGLQNLFRQMLTARMMQPVELYGRCPSYDHTVTLENLRAVPRHPLLIPLPVHMLENPRCMGSIHEITEHGLRTQGLTVTAHKSYTLVIAHDSPTLLPEPVVIDATCRWTRENGPEVSPIAGFEILAVKEGDFHELLALVRSFPFAEADDQEAPTDVQDEEEEESTETVDLANLFTTDVSSSGSFSFRGVTQTWFGKLLEALPIPVLLIDQSYRVAFLNHAWESVSPGYKKMRGEHFASLFQDPNAAKEAQTYAEQVFSKRKSLSTQAVLEFQHRKLWGRFHLRSVRMGSNRSILVLIEDLTHEKEQLLLKQIHNEELMAQIAERHRAEQALLQAERLKAVGELASGVSHNFNNLLQIVQGNAQLALANLQGEKLGAVRSNIQQIIDSSQIAAGTIRRLQDFSRARPEQDGSEGRVFDFSEMVRQAAEMSRIWWKTIPEKSGITIDLILALEPNCRIRGNEHELFEVVVNLIKNAAEALPNGGEIRVETRAQGDLVVLRVMDDGVGIRRADIGRVFEPFFTTKNRNSAGMGLSSSFGIVKSHGGTFSVKSTPGEGATFTVRIPGAGETLQPGGAPSLKYEFSLRILVIDDMEPIVTFLSTGLAEYGQTVFTALSGPEGLRLFEDNQVDVVICDLGMPGMNGWDVGAALQTLCGQRGIRKPPFIILTGWNDQAATTERLSQSGVVAVVPKPVEIPRLLEVIRDVVSPHLPREACAPQD